MADQTEDAALKAQFLELAADYRKLAETCSAKLGMAKPPDSSSPHSN
jgi:hypothetical protein